MKRSYFIYIATNFSNNVFYTGVTNNLERRILEHKFKIIEDSFTQKYKIYKLAWFQEFENVNEAIEAEKKIKGWTRAKKLELIKQNNSEFRNLAGTLR